MPMLKKKPKKKRKAAAAAGDGTTPASAANGEGVTEGATHADGPAAPSDTQSVVDNSDRRVRDGWAGDHYAYSYFELLRLAKQRPEARGRGAERDLDIPVADVKKTGQRKFTVNNFGDIVSTLRRDGEHVRRFISGEIGAHCDFSKDNAAIVVYAILKGGRIDNAVRQYAVDWVQCQICLAYTTDLTLDGQLYMLKCGICGAVRYQKPPTPYTAKS